MQAKWKWTAGFAALALTACNGAPAPDPELTEDETAMADPAMPETTDDAAAAATEDEEPAGLPQTDISLSTLVWNNGLPQIADRVIPTSQGSYDNQPAFDDGGFYFASETPGLQTDIFYYSLDSGAISRITDTPDESEYSPRPSPDGQSVTYIHQAPGGYGGQVYRHQLDGSATGPVHEYGPAGYYALAGDQSEMLLFALTDPFSLLWTDLELGIEEEITTGLGRALYTAPDGQSAFFTLEHPEGGFTVNRFSFTDASITPVFRLPGESEDYAVFTKPDGGLGWLSATSDTLFYRDDNVSSWQPIADLDAMGLSGVTRLAVSPSADRLAIVSNE